MRAELSTNEEAFLSPLVVYSCLYAEHHIAIGGNRPTLGCGQLFHFVNCGAKLGHNGENAIAVALGAVTRGLNRGSLGFCVAQTLNGGVSGSVQLRNYEDNQGVKRTAVDIVVQDVEFLTPKAGEGFDEFDAAPRSAAPAKKKPALKALDDDDSDIPF